VGKKRRERGDYSAQQLEGLEKELLLENRRNNAEIAAEINEMYGAREVSTTDDRDCMSSKRSRCEKVSCCKCY
jgi:hypothetical protein